MGSLLPLRSEAQATTASIHGTVTDPTGAILANATGTATHTSTGIASREKADSQGYFVFPDLHIGGPDTVTVEENGFQRFPSTGIMLDLGSAQKINARLQVGTNSQTVVVSSATVGGETSDVQLKNVLGAAKIEDLPTLGRDAV